MTRYDAYDPFAELYNRRWGGFATAALPWLDRLVLDELPVGAAVLDLCCGTGQLLAELADRGFDLIGVDGSSAMIDHARVNAPTATLLVDDARRFRLDRPVDAVVSTFDSLNHVMSAAEVSEVFARVADALRPGGIFVFDLNNHDGYVSRWRGSFCDVNDEEVIAGRSTYDEATREATLALTHFAKPGGDAGGWRRSDLHFTQRCHSDTEVRDALASAGIDDVQHWAFDELVPSSEAAGRSIYRGRRSA